MTTTPPEAEREQASTPQPEPPAAKPARPGLNTDTLALAGVFIAMFAFLAAIFAVGLASRAIDEHQIVAASGTTTGASGTTGAVPVVLEEFAIAPGTLDVPAGAVLSIENQGAIVHNLSVDGAASPMIDAGETAQLDLSSLAPGTYTMRCDVPGHEAAGMTGSLTIG